MRLFVTGGTGFIGSYFLKDAISKGYEIIALKHPERLIKDKQLKKVVWIDGRLNGEYTDYLKHCDVLVHFASVGVSPQVATWGACFDENLINSMKLIDQALNCGIRQFLIAGTSLEYGRSGFKYDFIPPDAALEPIGPYACSKASFFMSISSLAIEKKIKLSYLRVFSTYGVGQYKGNLWPSLRSAALSGENFKMTQGEQIRDFISAEKVAEIFTEHLSFYKVQDGKPNVKNIGSGEIQTVREFSEYWWNRWSAKGELKLGGLQYRKDEVMRYVPKLKD
jgi:nucleoside-diphosphate-sugar epimerase